MCAGQCQLDPDRSGRATCANQDNTLAAGVNDTCERHQESFPISILTDVLVAPTNCTIDGTHDCCGLAESIKMLYHCDFVWKRTVETGRVHGPSPANSVAQFFRSYLTI